MRSTRLRRFKNKNKKLLILLQIFCIWYCSLITVKYLTSATEAYFHDGEEIENQLHAAWQAVPPPNPEPILWDRSSLKFENAAGFDCVAGFYNFLKNGGDQAMKGPSTFVLYYQATGSPTPNNPGMEIARGEISILKKGQSIKLSFLPQDKPSKGTYKFMAYQRPGHPGNGELWGSEIIVTDTQLNACKHWESSSTIQGMESETTQLDSIKQVDQRKVELTEPKSRPDASVMEAEPTEPNEQSEATVMEAESTEPSSNESKSDSDEGDLTEASLDGLE
jgi:YqxM protein